MAQKYLVLKEKFLLNPKGDTSNMGFEYFVSDHPVYQFFTEDKFKHDYIKNDLSASWRSKDLLRIIDTGKAEECLNSEGCSEYDDNFPMVEGYDPYWLYHFFAKEITEDQALIANAVISNYNNIMDLKF